MKHFTLISALLMTFASSVFAADPAHLLQLKDTLWCEYCNLTDANLTRAELTGADLTDADLEGADLEGAFGR